MSRVLLVLLLLAVPCTGQAADRDLIQGVLQGVFGELERQAEQTSREQADARLLYDACLAGSSPACDLAVKSRWLGNKARRAVKAQMNRLEAERLATIQAHEQFVADWSGCGDRSEDDACARALAYPGLGFADRQTLEGWRHQIAAREAEAQRRHEAAIAAQQTPVTQTAETAAPVTITDSIPLAGPQRIETQRDPWRPQPWHLVVVVGLVATMWVLLQPERTMQPQQVRDPAASFASDLGPDPKLIPMTGDFATDVRRVLSG